jgi:hypothetical protein
VATGCHDGQPPGAVAVSVPPHPLRRAAGLVPAGVIEVARSGRAGAIVAVGSMAERG